MFRDVQLSPADPSAFVSLADAKGHLNIAGTGEDAFLSAALVTIARQIEAYTGNVITERTVTERVRLYDVGRSLVLRYSPATTLTSVAYDGETLQNADFLLASGVGILRRVDGADFMASADYVVTYTAGYATTPDDVKQAALEFVTAMYAAKGRDDSIKRESVPDVADVTYAGASEMTSAANGARIPWRAAAFLDPYCLRYTP